MREREEEREGEGEGESDVKVECVYMCMHIEELLAKGCI